MSSVVATAQPPLDFLPQRFSYPVWWTAARLLPLYIRYGLGLNRVEGVNVETLARYYEQFQRGQVRLLIAFRHPCTDDPLVMGYLMWHLLPQTAQRLGIRLQPPTNGYFLYDRGIPLWAGEQIGWLFSRLGGISIMRGKLDSQALRSARELLLEGRFPLAAAPEGATNEHNELVAPLEPGVAQLGFWCLEDLAKAGRSLPVVILPVGIQYSLSQPSWERMAMLMTQLENRLGCPTNSQSTEPQDLYRRLLNLAMHLLDRLETFYATSYRQVFPELPPFDSPNAELAARIQRLLNSALVVAESYFGLKASEDFISRCRRIEQAAWERMFRGDLDQLSSVERCLANWLAEEANVRLRHMRLAERFTSITGSYIREKFTIDRFADVALILWRTFDWLEGKSPNVNRLVGLRQVRLSVGDPLNLESYWPLYRRDRQGARQAVKEVTDQIRQQFEALIVPTDS
ncbi:1-acyl-sn-glycerol-3-phosphate acyltransferase [Thermosynechococcus sp. QKsg1]|uniref:1-acyl-sn-glycerol-3-phosphate acyltransferase n=1 Tax=Thermosynechococcus sp. QKsg1 TaxID=3074130 RepID=UPI0028778B78|nr:1-acyl-sn-glycerol-3-phosphate acyltransferase [Thermosynechococcus sp. QKsg1]WNC87122.1 1-acyl-sn-glycerol-3-phosphate acyltransferase [Thermosynechococcus sp. QKsg1]